MWMQAITSWLHRLYTTPTLFDSYDSTDIVHKLKNMVKPEPNIIFAIHVDLDAGKTNYHEHVIY